ncbi:MAG: HAMP domain-containing sensor histidine kinase [Planctomycetota bacterium]
MGLSNRPTFSKRWDRIVGIYVAAGVDRMFKDMLIRKKILLATIALCAMLSILVVFSFLGVYAYRGVTIDVGKLSTELTRIELLRQEFDDLRELLYADEESSLHIQRPNRGQSIGYAFLTQLHSLRTDLESHKGRLVSRSIASDPLLATTNDEIEHIEDVLTGLDEVENLALSLGITDPRVEIDGRLGDLSIKMRKLFELLTQRMEQFRDRTRLSYRTWIGGIYFATFMTATIVGWTFWFFRSSIVRPFKQLLEDANEISTGAFHRRIQLQSKDELAQLGDAMNSMTDRFVQIRDNLNQKVQERTQEVVRSEQLASVGFLAAGVAHEINNPLASIAWSAEALESRLHEVLHDSPQSSDATSPHEDDSAANAPFDEEQIDILRDYLKRIQDEAFRCKGITERLLDFSRLGESSKKQETDINEAVADVCALVKHLGQYRNRHVQFTGTPGLFACVSPTEFKQVVLNLLTNALDASEDGDTVQVYLEATAEALELRVVDQGCGMTPEVAKNLFEPFFTRRRDGRGTGLGLSISYQIVQDHGGSLIPYSLGPGKGSKLTLTIPLQQTHHFENQITRSQYAEQHEIKKAA